MPSLERLFAYDAWANRESLAAARAAGSPAAALRLIAHVAAAERLWMGRLDGEGSPPAVWPDWSGEACADALRRLAAEWTERIRDLGPSEGARAVAYVNSKGEPWTTTVDDILAHVLLHSSYHRGQVAYVLRAGGIEPPYTDYVHCVRNGLIE